MGAAKDDGACGGALAGQIMGPMEVAVFVATAGGSGAAKGGKAAGMMAKMDPKIVKACDDLVTYVKKNWDESTRYAESQEDDARCC